MRAAEVSRILSTYRYLNRRPCVTPKVENFVHPRQPCRIVSLVPAATEIVFALGRGDDLVGVGEECLLPPGVRLPRLTKTLVDANAAGAEIDAQVRELLSRGEPLYQIDEAALAGLAPDVLLTQRQCSVCAVDEQEAVGVVDRLGLSKTHVVATAASTLEGVLEDMQRVGVAVDAQAAAERQVAALRGRLAAAARRRGPGEKMRVACIEWFEPLMIAGAWTPELVDIAGGYCPLAEPGRHAPTISWEALEEFDPELIVLCPCGFDLDRTAREVDVLQNHAAWRRLTAVRRSQVFLLDGLRALTTPGPGLVAVAEVMAAWIADEQPPTTSEALPWRRFNTSP